MPATSSAFYTNSKAPKSSKSPVTCTWCNKSGHEEAQCNRKDRDRKRAQNNTQFYSKRRPYNANKVQEDPKVPETTQGSAKVTEFAGNASARSKSLLLSSPLQLNADFHWLADTGVTSHMTPHHHWFKSYIHFRTPVCLANNTIIFSAGVGSMVFEPVVDGKQVRAVEFSRVLHVPDRRSNFFFFFVQQFITWCSIAVRGKLPTTSSSQVPQRKEPPITGREIQSHQNRDLT